MVHVAFIVRRGEILASASNRVGSRSRGAGYSSMTIHAEMNCIKKLGDLRQLRGADMYVIRMDKNRCNPQATPNFQTSKPCHHCETVLRKLMREFGLKNVYYTA